MVCNKAVSLCSIQLHLLFPSAPPGVAKYKKKILTKEITEPPCVSLFGSVLQACTCIWYLGGVQPVVRVVITWCTFEGGDDGLGHSFTNSRHVVILLHRNRETSHNKNEFFISTYFHRHGRGEQCVLCLGRSTERRRENCSLNEYLTNSRELFSITMTGSLYQSR